MIKVFFIFKIVCLFTAIIITFANQNPVYAVLHLVTFFVTGSFLLLFLGVDFLPYVFIIVYAGAVAVLFLFIVIILKIKLGSTQINYRNIIIMFFSSIGLSSLTYSLPLLNRDKYNGITIGSKQENFDENPISSFDLDFLPSSIYKAVYTSNENYYTYDTQSSLTNLGKILYTEYNTHFIVCGLILLVAIIGAISLTRGYNTSLSLKQKIFMQTTRSSVIGKITV